MWKTITESEIWFDNLVLLIKQLIKRKVALDDFTPLDDYIEVETDNGLCEASVHFSDTSILNMNYGRAGEYSDESFLINLENILNDTEKRPKIDVKLSLKELESYNDLVVLPLYTNELILTGDLHKENNIGFLLQDNNIQLENAFKNLGYLDKLVIFEKNLFNASYSYLNYGKISKMVLNHLYINHCNYVVESCYIRNLYTTIDGLYNFDYCIVDAVKLLHIMDFDDFVSGPSISSDISVINERLNYLHKLSNEKGIKLATSHFNLSNYLEKLKKMEINGSLSNDIFYLYLSDEIDDAGFIEYFDLVLDEYINIISERFLISKSKIEILDIKNRMISFTYDNGLKVVVILTKNSCSDIYSAIVDGEMSKYK